MDRVARNAGEDDTLTTRRGDSTLSSKVGDRVGRAAMENVAAAFVPEARTGDICGDASDGLRAKDRELSLKDGDVPDVLRRLWTDEVLRTIPGLRFSEVPEATFRSAGATVEVLDGTFFGLAEEGGGGTGRGRLARTDERAVRTGEAVEAAGSTVTLTGDAGVANTNFSGVCGVRLVGEDGRLVRVATILRAASPCEIADGVDGDVGLSFEIGANGREGVGGVTRTSMALVGDKRRLLASL